MSDNYAKLGRILGTSPEVLSSLDQVMSGYSGKSGVFDLVANENDTKIDLVLADLSLTRESSADEVYNALTGKLMQIDQKLFEFLGKPDLSQMSDDPGVLRDVPMQIYTPPKGLFIKRDRVAELLKKQPPQSLIDHFGYATVEELLEKEGFASVVAALRFTQTQDWMHQFFDVAYADLKPEDFEEREVEIKVLATKWLDIAQKFIGKKFHNVSHLKEFGIIFISPEPIDVPGETLRTFLLLMHYLHEVPFYSGLFRKFLNDTDFIPKLQSLLRGDVPAQVSNDPKTWMIVQRYLAKDDPNDPRLHAHHVDPEAEHWYLVAHNFQKLAEVMGDGDKFNIAYWTELDHIGDFFPIEKSFGKAQDDKSQRLVSFDVVDLVMSLVKKGEVKYLYHQQEALWNKIFCEYLSRDKMNQLIEENIVGGFIKL